MNPVAPIRRPRGLSLAAPGLLGPELALVALADGLFWGRAFGLSLPLFCAAAALAAVWLRPCRRGAARTTLYGWCFLDVPRLVADYDVAHCAELKGEGPKLDAWSLIQLGPEAIPAVDRYLLGFRDPGMRFGLTRWRERSARELRDGLSDWRGWSLAGWRLARYLDRSGVAEPATPPAGDDGS